MNTISRYSIRRENYGDEDKNVWVYDIFDREIKSVVESFLEEEKAREWIARAEAVESSENLLDDLLVEA